MEEEPVMRARLLLTATVIAAAVHGVSGQTQTADGVAALARGEYQRAAEILKPIAEDWRTSDTAAQFFMAGLYETGRGVSADPLRACALYTRAVSKDDHPFGRAAAPLLFRLIGRGGPEFNQECQLLANIGFDHGFEPVRFDLGPGHSVEWTLTATTVTYDGRTRRYESGSEMPGVRFATLRHTELATGPTRSLTRHFIEGFVWRPAGKPDAWGLHWGVSEVVGDEIVSIHNADPLVTVEGDAPPSRETFDVRAYAVVRVDNAGNPEWAVLKGPGRRTQRIESHAERREDREQALARDRALKRVDWDERSDVYRQPAMTYSDADGCGLLEVYAWTADRAEAIVVRVAAEALGLSTQPATFDLSRGLADIFIEAHVYDAPQRQFYFCTDVGMPRAMGSIGPETWRAVGGTLTIELSPPGIRAHGPHLRRATLSLTNVVLRNVRGMTVSVPGPVRLTALVGAMVGP